MRRSHLNFALIRDFLQNREDPGHHGKNVWVDVLKNFRTDDIIWRVHRLSQKGILYMCGNFRGSRCTGFGGDYILWPSYVSKAVWHQTVFRVTTELIKSSFEFWKSKYKKIVGIAHDWKKTERFTFSLIEPYVTPSFVIWIRNRVVEKMPNQEQGITSTMKDKLRKPQSELELLQELMKKEMTQWDHERSSFNNLVYLERLKVDEKDG
ncbi:hypothetical protein V6N11_035487 [Hibiscus sabdariffa]|uniref:Uncharacterized protein n=1 Tax=Hibiscus sabdariffa TaxID=183260 RepID=A0ABR2R0G1_9ROSI